MRRSFIKKMGVGISALALIGLLGVGCATTEDVNAAKDAAEAAAKRAEAAAIKAEAAAAKCEKVSMGGAK